MAWLICCLCSTRIMRQIISYRGRTRATAEQQREPEQGKPTHLTSDRQQAGRACGCASVLLLLSRLHSRAQGGFGFGFGFSFVLFSLLIQKCSRHYPFGKMLRIVFVRRGVLTLVSLPHVVSVSITISVAVAAAVVVVVGLVDVTISSLAAAHELWFLNCFLCVYLLLNCFRSSECYVFFFFSSQK